MCKCVLGSGGAERGSDFTVFGGDRAGRPSHRAGMFGASAGDFQSAGFQHVHSKVARPESCFLGDQDLLTGVLEVQAVTLSLHVQLFSCIGKKEAKKRRMWELLQCDRPQHVNRK